MIQFDNGPAGGDYARYIDGLLAQRMPVASMDKDGFVAPRSPGERPPAVPVAAPAPAPRPTPGAPLSPVQASALASTMVAQAQSGAVVDGRTVRDLLGIAIGAALLLIGIVVDHAGLLFVIAGVGLIAALLKRIGQRRLSSQTSAAATKQALAARAAARR